MSILERKYVSQTSQRQIKPTLSKARSIILAGTMAMSGFSMMPLTTIVNAEEVSSNLTDTIKTKSSETDKKTDELKQIATTQNGETDSQSVTSTAEALKEEITADYKIDMNDSRQEQLSSVVESLASKVEETEAANTAAEKDDEETTKLTKAVSNTSEASVLGQTLATLKATKESIAEQKSEQEKAQTNNDKSLKTLSTQETFSYLYDDYLIQIKDLDMNKSGYQKAIIEFTQLSNTSQQLLNMADSSDVVDTDKTIASVIKSAKKKDKMSESIQVQMVDTSAPVITLNDNDRTITAGDALDLNSYIASVTDAEDGDLTYSIDGAVDTATPGQYTVNITATDSAGNTSVQPLTINVQKNIQGTFYDKIAEAALAQIGVNQDCTMLVTNSLKAVGINFHGWPYQYLSLGTVTSNPVPGDICVYQGHVAVYVGNGQAVHGGWMGYTTVKSSVACSNAFIAYVHVTPPVSYQ